MPLIIGVQLTRRCNFHCDHCFVDRSGNDLDLKSLMKIVSFAKASNSSCLHFTGGEPTLHSRFPEVLEILSKNNLKFTMVTNGWNFLTSHQIIKSYVRNVKRLDFSLDGASEEIHDLNRQNGSYRRVLQGISICRYTELPFGLRTTITQRNIDQLEDIAFLAAKVGAEELIVNPVQPTSRLATLNLLLYPDDLRRISNEVLRLQKIFKIKISRSTGYFDLDPFALCYPLTMKELFINSRGDISFCCQLTDYEDSQNGTDLLGNLEEVSLYGAQRRMVDTVAQYEKNKISYFSKGWFSPLDYCPCWYCLKYFGKVDWLLRFPDNPWCQDLLKSKHPDWEVSGPAVQEATPEYPPARGDSPICGASIFHPDQEVIETVLSEDEGTLIHVGTKLSYALNRTGMRIWRLLKDGNCARDIVEKLHQEFEVDRDRLQKDVVNILEELLSLKLVIPSGKS